MEDLGRTERQLLRLSKPNLLSKGKYLITFVLLTDYVLYLDYDFSILSRFRAPEGLVQLLERFALKPGKSADMGWSRLNGNLWAKLRVSKT